MLGGPSASRYAHGGYDVRSRDASPPSSVKTGSWSPQMMDARRTTTTIVMPVHVATPRPTSIATSTK